MLQLSVQLRQTPVLLSPSCANISECQMVPLVGHVSVRNGHPREVGGIRVVWEAQVQRRCRKRNGKYYWIDGDIIDRFEVDVLRGPICLPAGASAFEFVIEIPLNLVSSRTTHFDKISHKLHAAILGASPCYDHLTRNAKGRSPLAGLIPRLPHRYRHACKVFGTTPILAHAVEPVNVFNCDTEGESTAYNWRYSSEMAGLGHLLVAIDSQQFILGQTADLAIEINGLSPTTTIHSITANLVQTTTIASCPSKYSTGRAISPKDSGIRSDVTEKYELYPYGTSWGRMPGRIRPYRGSYLWRGSEAVGYVTDVFGKELPLVDRSSEDGFAVSTALTLPSPVVGTHPTDTRENPAFSTISHHLEVQIQYSILGQGLRGEALSSDGSEVMEGAVRTWTLEKALQIHSDLSSVTSTAAPPYSPSHAPSQPYPADLDINPKSLSSPWSISLGWTKATLMRPVKVSPEELKKRTRQHWEETSGMCACFDNGHARDSVETSETIIPVKEL